MRAPRPLAAALAAVAAMGVAFAPDGVASTARTFGAPVHVDTGNYAAEPSIVVAPDGTELVVAPAGPGVRAPAPIGALGIGGDLLWRSMDHGRTWSTVNTYDMGTGGSDSDIAVAPDGTLYASGLTYPACATVSRSGDGGRTWLGVPMSACARSPLVNDRQWNATAGNDTLYTVVGDPGGREIDLIRSGTGGALVLPSTTMRLTTAQDYQWPGTVAVDPRRGTAYTVWNTVGAPNDCDHAPGSAKCEPTEASTTKPDRILVSVVRPGVTTPPAPTLVAARRFDTFDSFVVDAVDAAGTVYVTWTERHPRAGGTWSMLSSSRDGGRTWSAPTRVSRAPRTAAFAWVTAGDAGRIAVSYYGTAAAGSSPQTVAGTARWSVYSAFSTDGGRTFDEYRTTGVMHRGVICTSGSGCAVGTRNLLDFFETAADRTGCLVTAYADNTVHPDVGAVVSYVRQTGGPGLRAGRACSVAR